MSCNDAQAVALCQGGDIGLAADTPLAVVGATKNLIDQEKHTPLLFFFRLYKQGFKSLHLSVEIGIALGDRVVNPDAGEKPEKRCVELACIHRATGIRQAKVDAERAQERAFPRHIGAGDDSDLSRLFERKIIDHFFLEWNKGMSKFAS